MLTGIKIAALQRLHYKMLFHLGALGVRDQASDWDLKPPSTLAMPLCLTDSFVDEVLEQFDSCVTRVLDAQIVWLQKHVLTA